MNDCPACGQKTRKVGRATLDALLCEGAKARTQSLDGYRFCPAQQCKLVYAGPGAEHFGVEDLTVRVFQKETDRARFVCYCFEHSVQEVQDDASPTGESPIADAITERCRQHLDRCELTNPQGSCCLGNVRGVARPPAASSSAASPSFADHAVGAQGCCGSPGEGGKR